MCVRVIEEIPLLMLINMYILTFLTVDFWNCSVVGGNSSQDKYSSVERLNRWGQDLSGVSAVCLAETDCLTLQIARQSGSAKLSQSNIQLSNSNAKPSESRTSV